MARRVLDRQMYEHGSKWFADWHRNQDENLATMIDLDGFGYCPRCYAPLYLVEATQRKRRKLTPAMDKLAERARVEAVLVYRDEGRPGEFLVDWRNGGLDKPEWRTENEVWNLLMSFRRAHRCTEPRR